jgi:hypothetical protein
MFSKKYTKKQSVAAGNLESHGAIPEIRQSESSTRTYSH